MNAYPAIYTPIGYTKAEGRKAVEPIACVVFSHHLIQPHHLPDDPPYIGPTIMAVAVDGLGRHFIDEIQRFQAFDPDLLRHHNTK